MITRDPVPARALKRTFVHRGLERVYHVWDHYAGKWAWKAAGKSGVSASAVAAELEARRWIRDGQ